MDLALRAEKLASFLQESGLSYKTTNNSYIFTCPRCQKHDKLYIYRSGKGFVCFVCREDIQNGHGFAGKPEYALAELTGKSVRDIRDEIYGASLSKLSGNLIDIEQDDDEIAGIDMLDDVPDSPWPYHCYELNDKNAAEGVAYLESRGIPADIAMQYQIRYSTAERSIAFPVLVGTKLVGWQCRTIDPLIVTVNGKTFKRTKSISTPGIPRDRIVMFQNRLIGAKSAVVCEGPVDALKCHFFGTGNVATMGKAVSDGQISVIKNSGVESVYLALDPDAALEAPALAVRFGGMPVSIVTIPAPYKDIGEMPFQEAKEAILAAEPFKKTRVYMLLKS